MTELAEVGSGTTASVGLILAGGRSRRFVGGTKALRTLAGRTMIERVIERLAPQVRSVILAVGAGHDGLDELGRPCVYDSVPSFRGPLAGLQAGLQSLGAADDGAEWLQLAPCDAPFLPDDLVDRLLPAASDETLVVVPSEGDQLQPTFSAWRRSALAAVDEALSSRGGAGLLDVLRDLPHVAVPWPETSPPAFFNVNSADDLEVAEQWIQADAS